MSELDKILKKAEKEHDLLKHPYVGTEHLLLSLLSYDNDLTDSLKKYNLTYNKFKRNLKEIIGMGSTKSPYVLYTPMLRKVLSNVDENDNNIHVSLFNSIIKSKEGIAIRIMESMNIDIDNINLYSNDYMKVDLDYKVIEREKEINEIIQILLRKNKCNPLLIGEAGVGKSAIVEEIQRKLIKGDVPSCLKDYKIISVDMSSLVAGTKYRGDFESKVNDLINKVLKNKSILFIDEIHTLVSAGGAEGAIKCGDILKPYLARGNIKCIGATTSKEYHKYFEVDDALNRRFQTIYIKEPSINSTKNILKEIKISYEKYYNITVEDNLIDEIIDVSSKYIKNKYNPDKSIELLDSTLANAKFFDLKVVNICNLYNIIECRYGISLNNKKIKEILDNKRIIYNNEIIINDEINKIIIDGNDYKREDDLYKLLGNNKINNSNYLFKSIIDIPLGIISFRNINSNKILKEFIFNIINNRYIIDNFGNKIDFSNYIIMIDGMLEDEKIGFSEEKVDYDFIH